jgi:phosphoribosylamine---glycine ligase
MNVLLVDRGSYFLDFALRCKRAGHAVRWWKGKTKSNDRSVVGDGFGLDVRPDWEPSMRWADIVLLPDNSTLIEPMRKYWKGGFPIFGPNETCAEWELNRDVGAKVFEDCGIETIPAHKFKSIGDAAEFLRANPARYVSKVNDDNDSKALSYVSKSARDMMFMLDRWKKLGLLKGEFIFQQFIKGTEVAVGGWFGPGGFSEWFLENFEHKKLMAGDIGVNTGEMGTVLKYTKESALAEALLRPLEGHLYRAGYVGYIDVAVMVAADGTPYPLEFTTRPGWPLFEIQQALHPDPVEWMGDLLDGKDTFHPRTSVAVGVCVTMPDFPFCATPQKEKCGFPLYGADDIPEVNFHPSQVMIGTAPNEGLVPEEVMVTAGECVCTISGVGSTVEAAAKKAYRHVKMLELRNSPMYRNDIGKRLERDLPEVQKHGWCAGWEYENEH